MRKEKLVGVMTAFAYFVCCAHADDEVVSEEATSPFSVSIESSVWSQYVFADTGQVFHDRPVLQSELVIETTWGVYATIWHSMGLNDGNLSGDYGDEVDYYIGYARDIGPVTLDVGFSYFDAIDLFEGPRDDTFYLYAGIGKTFEAPCGILTPYVRGNFYINGDDSEVEGGTVASFGLEYEPALPTERLTLPMSIQFGYDDGTYGMDNGLVSRVALDANWQLGEHWTIMAPRLALYVPLTVDDERETEFVAGGGILFSF